VVESVSHSNVAGRVADGLSDAGLIAVGGEQPLSLGGDDLTS
jgi:hypothetical protein